MRSGVWLTSGGPSLTDGLWGGSEWECAQRFPLKSVPTIVCDPLWENWRNVVVVGVASASIASLKTPQYLEIMRAEGCARFWHIALERK